MGLRVLIVGGGLAGLASAVTLRRAGHKVQVFESSQLAHGDVVGPVVHLGPKSNELLQQWGLDSTVARGVLVKEIPQFSQDGTLKVKGDQSQRPGWEYYDRSHLHKALRDSAVASDGVGDPVEISLGTRVASANPDTAEITLDDGRVFQADAMVGADGFHSVIRQSITEERFGLSGPAKTAVHFTVDVTSLGHNSVIQRFQDEPQRFEKWTGADLELLVHAVEPGSLLFDLMVPITEPTDINAELLREKILKAFQPGHTDFLQVLEGIKTRDIHFWTQQNLPRVDKWASNRLVLVGDAAHPFLAYELPGTAQTLNDAAALAAELGPNIGSHEIEERLRAWEIPRQERVKTIQQMERASWPTS